MSVFSRIFKCFAIFEDFSKWNVQKPTSNSRILIYENNDIYGFQNLWIKTLFKNRGEMISRSVLIKTFFKTSFKIYF